MIRELKFKDINDLSYLDKVLLSEYVEGLTDCDIFDDNFDYVFLNNRLRHILEIVSDYGENVDELEK